LTVERFASIKHPTTALVVAADLAVEVMAMAVEVEVDMALLKARDTVLLKARDTACPPTSTHL
jgi:hypothetical protein